MKYIQRFLVYGAAAITCAVTAIIIIFVFIQGIPHLSLELFSFKYTSENVSMMPAIINTLLMTLISLIIAVPLGIGAAIYLIEYSSKNSRLVPIIRLMTETLSGIPSIVYGLFGMLFFVTYLGWSMSLLAGACTMSIMILPTIIRTTEEALMTVPDSYREGSFGLGAGRLRTVVRVVLPSAMPGILSGVILGVGRIVGETAAVMYTAGTVAKVPENLFGSARTLSVHMYILSGEGFHIGEAFSTAIVLILIVIGINALSAKLAKKLTAK